MLAWHVICASPQQEIRASLEITKAGFDVFYPIKHYTRIRLNRKPETVSGPLFPRYLFAAFDRAQSNWGKIKDLRGVSSILCNGNQPVIVRNEVVIAIRSYREPVEAVQAISEFSSNQRVVITTGVLEGIEGLFTGSDRQRTKAFLEILGKRYEIPYETISAA